MWHPSLFIIIFQCEDAPAGNGRDQTQPFKLPAKFKRERLCSSDVAAGLDDLEVKTFIGLDQAVFESIIDGVVDVAHEEANIEHQLTVIRKRCAWIEFQFRAPWLWLETNQFASPIIDNILLKLLNQLKYFFYQWTCQFLI